MKLKLGIIAILALLATLAACSSTKPLQSAAQVDIERFGGEWYVIANIPYFMERNRVASKTIYERTGPTTFNDIFVSKRGSFDAQSKRVAGKLKSISDDHTQWQARFYWVLNSQFSVLDIDPEHQIMLLGVASRELGWVFAREPKISAADYAKAMATFAEFGYDTSLFSKVPQFPEQLGQPGFQEIEQN